MITKIRKLFPTQRAIPLGENPELDKRIQYPYRYIYIFCIFYSVFISIIPHKYLEFGANIEIISYLSSNFSFFRQKYETLETAKEGLGLKFSITFCLFTILLLILAPYCIFTTIYYWRPYTKSDNNSVMIFSFLFAFICAFLILPYIVFIHDMSIRDKRYPGSLILYNSEYYIFLVSILMTFMSHATFVLTAYALKLTGFRENAQ